MRRLLHIGTVLVLVVSCCGGALSASPCPRDCHAAAGAHSHLHARPGGAESAGHCRAEMNDGEAGRAGEASDHESHDAGGYAGAQASSDESSGVAGSAHSPCGHCMGGAELPSSSLTEREAGQLKKGGGVDSPGAGARLARPAAGFVREITPYEDGPPSPVHRHVLIGVFRI